MKYFLSLVASGLAASTFFQQILAERQLSAATLQSSLKTRSNDVHLRKIFDLHYVEEQSSSSATTGAWLEVESKFNTLLLEEIEHLAEYIECTSDASLNVAFHPSYFQQARKTFEKSTNLLLITSHAGCNAPGTRMPYKALGCTFDGSKSLVKFALSEASWKDDFKMKMGFSPAHVSAYGVRKHGHPVLGKRGLFDQASASASLSSVTVSSTSIVASQSEITFPTVTATGELPSHTVVDNVGASLKNTTILPPSLDNITVGIPFHDIPITVTCIDCTTFGQVTLLSGYFSVSNGTNTSSSSSSSNLLTDATEAEQFLTDGFLEMQANGLGAHIALDMQWDPSFTEPLDINLPSIPLDPFAIPGVANVGVTFQPIITIAATISSAFDFQYGFDVHVPNNSTALASLGDASNSSVTGFEQTQISALPLNSTFGNITMTLSATLQPKILLGISLLDQNAGVAVFLNMPQVSVAISQVTGTNEKCETGAQASDITSVGNLLGNLTHVVPEVQLAAGFVIEAGQLGQTAYTPLATTFTMDTTCLAFKTAGSAYVPATAAFASATSSQASASRASASRASVSATASSAANAPRLEAFREGLGGSGAGGRWQAAVVALALVFGGFVAL